MFFLTALVLVACNQGKPSAPIAGEENDSPEASDTLLEEMEKQPEYNTTDALALGLQGKVASVQFTVYTTYENGDELVEAREHERGEATFDGWGHVTKDEWGNAYGYDAEGNYYRGNHTYTLMERDGKSRVAHYKDVEGDNDGDVEYRFLYDKQGRIKSVSMKGWSGTWDEKRSYEGTKLYPSKAVKTGTYEGGGAFEQNREFRYMHFDEQGNWTERLIVELYTEMDEQWGWNEETQQEEQMEVKDSTEQILIEKRMIIYHE